MREITEIEAVYSIIDLIIDGIENKKYLPCEEKIERKDVVRLLNIIKEPIEELLFNQIENENG